MEHCDNQPNISGEMPSPVTGDRQKSGRAVRPVRHHEIADWLRERIESEELTPGWIVPGTGELAATFGVAPSTARRALDALMYEGLIDSRTSTARIVQFRPSFRRVVSRSYRRDPSMWRAFEPNSKAETRRVRSTEEIVPDAVARVLRIPTSTVVSVHRSTTQLYDRPVELATVYRTSGADVNTENDFLRVREELRLRLPNSTERDKLDLPLGVPVAEITKTVYRKAEPLELGTLIIDGSCFIFEYDYFVEGCDYVT